MPQKMRRNFSGAFMPQDRGRGEWQLIRSAPHDATVYVRDAQRDAAGIFGRGIVADLGIEWRGQEVLLTFMSNGKAASVAAGSAIVHEPLSGLYAGLPLASIDARARRFWRRVLRPTRRHSRRI